MRISDWSSDVCSSDLFDPGSNEDIISGPARLIEAGRSSCLSRDTLFLNGGRDRTAQQPGPKEYRAAGDGEDLATLGELAKYFQQRRCLSVRSEEHTSELQSLMRISYAVFCLKKKTKQKKRQK